MQRRVACPPSRATSRACATRSFRASPAGSVPDDPDHRVVVDRLAAALGDALVTTVDPDTRVRRADACLAWAARFDWSRMREDARDLTIEMINEKLTDGAASSGLHHPRDARVAV